MQTQIHDPLSIFVDAIHAPKIHMYLQVLAHVDVNIYMAFGKQKIIKPHSLRRCHLCRKAGQGASWIKGSFRNKMGLACRW